MPGQTNPSDGVGATAEPNTVVASHYRDPNGSLFVHRDLVQVRKAWEDESHVSPPSGELVFGDVESWASYVHRYAGDRALLTWNKTGLRAELDHHTPTEGGRRKWVALMPFQATREWRAWQGLASGSPVAHKAAVETLEDLAEWVVEPAYLDLVAMLRGLKASASAAASTELRADGTASVSFEATTKVTAGTKLEIPSAIVIAVPALVGHLDDVGRPVLYRLPVRVRVSVDDGAKLAFRFSAPTAERTLEDAYADRVAKARELLGDGFSLLRAA